MGKLMTTIVKLNGQYYAGEKLESYPSSFKGVGWQDYKNCELNLLKFSDNREEAKIIEGSINLKSVLDKILQRVRDGIIDLKTLEILNEGRGEGDVHS